MTFDYNNSAARKDWVLGMSLLRYVILFLTDFETCNFEDFDREILENYRRKWQELFRFGFSVLYSTRICEVPLD